MLGPRGPTLQKHIKKMLGPRGPQVCPGTPEPFWVIFIKESDDILVRKWGSPEFRKLGVLGWAGP